MSIFFWVLALFLNGSLLQAGVPEYASKAGIIVQMLSYVQWPSESTDARNPFELVVFGKSPFGHELDDIARQQTIRQHPIRIRYVTRFSDVGHCQALFICRSEAPRIDLVTDWARLNRVLTISDSDAFLDKGIMVNLLLEETIKGGFVRLVVNPEEAKAGGLTLSSQLLRHAKIIGPPPSH